MQTRAVAWVLVLGACACAPVPEAAEAGVAPPRTTGTARAAVVANAPVLAGSVGAPPMASAAPVVASAAVVPTATSGPPAAPAPAARPDPTIAYPWLADSALHPPEVASALDERIAPPPGFQRVPLSNGSFGAWLRRLPLAAAGTPVRSHRGAVILAPEHPNLAAVVALDVGTGDLQQCADSVMRLHAEWQWSKGRRDQSYRAASGFPLPFSRWAAGERVVNEGASLRWTGAKKADSSHGTFRAWLDTVFAWANTGSLARDTLPVALADLRPGDFVVQPGGPGHAVLVLDLAMDGAGHRVALLGQGFMPAQSFQVLRPSAEGPWFPLVEAGLTTPFWPTFPWSTLHRFEGG